MLLTNYKRSCENIDKTQIEARLNGDFFVDVVWELLKLSLFLARLGGKCSGAISLAKSASGSDTHLWRGWKLAATLFYSSLRLVYMADPEAVNVLAIWQPDIPCPATSHARRKSHAADL